MGKLYGVVKQVKTLMTEGSVANIMPNIQLMF